MKKAFSIIQETFLIHFKICSKHVFWRLREENKGVDGKGSFWGFGVLAQHTQHVFSLSFEISFWFNWYCKSLVRLLHVWLCYGLVKIFFPPFKSHVTNIPTFPPQTITLSQTTQTQVLYTHTQLLHSHFNLSSPISRQSTFMGPVLEKQT